MGAHCPDLQCLMSSENCPLSPTKATVNWGAIGRQTNRFSFIVADNSSEILKCNGSIIISCVSCLPITYERRAAWISLSQGSLIIIIRVRMVKGVAVRSVTSFKRSWASKLNPCWNGDAQCLGSPTRHGTAGSRGGKPR